MAAKFTVLASGSSGNVALLQAGGFGLLIDCGVSARQLTHLLGRSGFGWRHVNAAILTHTHGDHWSRSALSALAKHDVALWCHCEHAVELQKHEEFTRLADKGMVQHYAADGWHELTRDLRVQPTAVSHDAEPTYAFRLEGPSSLFGAGWSIGFASDLGVWQDNLAELFSGVDVLAVEFNHDVRMQKMSRRPDMLIQRVLGPKGHLSNEQGAGLVRAIQERTNNHALKAMIPLHRSRECNRAELVDAAARDCLFDLATDLYLSHQTEPTPTIELGVTKTVRVSSGTRRVKRDTATPGLFD